MKKIWITYSWKDNEASDVDFINQELSSCGLNVKLDRWNLSAGKRLWEQIDTFIKSPEESDAWLFVATQNSLTSQSCKEELAYALDRALHSRGDNYPIITLFLGPVDESLIPASIRTRLFISITDPDWKERVVSSVNNESPEIPKRKIDPYFLKIYQNIEGKKYVVEVRPRAGVWSPFIAGILFEEKEDVNPSIMHGPKELPTCSGRLDMCGDRISKDNKYFLMFAGNPATPNDSYYICCDNLPIQLVFGENRPNGIQYTVTF